MAEIGDVLRIAGEAVELRTAVDPIDEGNAVPYALFKIAAELEQLNDTLARMERQGRGRWPQRGS